MLNVRPARSALTIFCIGFPSSIFRLFSGVCRVLRTTAAGASARRVFNWIPKKSRVESLRPTSGSRPGAIRTRTTRLSGHDHAAGTHAVHALCAPNPGHAPECDAQRQPR
jgi:hypothetical protein